MKPLRIFIAGEGSGGVRLIRSLVDAGHKISGILASPENPSLTSVWKFATQKGIPAYASINARYSDFAETIRSSETDLFIAVRFPYIIDSEVLSAPNLGSYNIHTGPLPEYAGLNVISWALYNEENRHGVTLHKMDSGIDTGPIAAQVLFDILETDTALTLTEKCIETGCRMAFDFVEQIANNETVELRPQSLNKRRYYNESAPNDGWIDWSAPATKISHFLRACDFHPFPSPWGSPRTTYGDNTVEIIRGHPADINCHEKPGTILIVNGNKVNVATGNGQLAVDLIKYGEELHEPYLVFAKKGRHLRFI